MEQRNHRLLQLGPGQGGCRRTVALLMDGIPIGAPVAGPANGEFQFKWDTTGIAVGTHTLAIEATDSGGASALIGIRRFTLVR